jgi:hypothetical protein
MIYGSIRHESTTGLRKLYNEECQCVLFTRYYSDHQIKEDKMGRESCMSRSDKQAIELEGRKLVRRSAVD